VSSHARNGFEDGRIGDRVLGIAAPGERAVAGYQDGGHFQRFQTQLFERGHDHFPRLAFVVTLDLLAAQWTRDRHGSMKVIGVGGAKGRDHPARLGPARGL
jgi:hypothetical protein